MNSFPSVYWSQLFHCIIPFQYLSYWPVDIWFSNLTWYQSLVQAKTQTLETFIVHQKQLSFHIIPGTIALLPLDFIQRILSRCDGIWKSAHVEAERIEMTYDCELVCFAVIFCRCLHSFLKYFTDHHTTKWRILLLIHPESLHPSITLIGGKLCR